MNEDKCESIKRESEENTKRLNNQLTAVHHELLLQKIDDELDRVEHFREINIDSMFEF